MKNLSYSCHLRDIIFTMTSLFLLVLQLVVISSPHQTSHHPFVDSQTTTNLSSSSTPLLMTSTTFISTMTTAAATTTTTTSQQQQHQNSNNNNNEELFTPVQIKILPDSLTGAQIRGEDSVGDDLESNSNNVIHLLLRYAHWAAPVNSYVALQPLILGSGELPVVTPFQTWPREYWAYLNPHYNVSSPLPPPQNFGATPFGWWNLPPQPYNGTFIPSSASTSSVVSANVSTWGEPVNQEDELLDAQVQTALSNGDLVCYIFIVSVSEGNLICNGTIFPAEDEQMMIVLPPYLLVSLDPNASSSSTSSSSSPVFDSNSHINNNIAHPQNAPYTVRIVIRPEEYLIQTVRRYMTSIAALVALVSTIVGKEPHIHVMSLARMSLIGRVLECSDEVDLILHPTHIRLGRGFEKGRYFGALIFNTAICMGLLIGHNVIARVFPRLLPDPPPSLQFVIAGALLPGITLAGLKTVTLQSSPVQFFLACVVMVLFIGAWIGCYLVTSRDKNFFHRFGRWQHRTDPFFMIRWRVFFTSYKAKRRFYVLIEIFITLFMAVPSGVTLSDYLDRDQSCWYRSLAMIGLVGADTLLLILVLRPYAIKIDTVVYSIAKLFELSISASAVARMGNQKYAFEIGTIFWIAGAMFIGVWQAYRAYDKAQYNSQQNEFFLTTADTADISFNNELVDEDEDHNDEVNNKSTTRHLDNDHNNNIGDEEEDLDEKKSINQQKNNRKKKTLQQQLFPESDYHNSNKRRSSNSDYINNDDDEGGDDYDDDDVEFGNGHSNNNRKAGYYSPSSRKTAKEAIILEKHQDGNRAEVVEEPRTKTSTNRNRNNNRYDDQEDDLEMALLTTNAPRLQLAQSSEKNHRNNNNNNNHHQFSSSAALSIPPSVGTVSLPDDPLIEFWDALSAENNHNNKTHHHNNNNSEDEDDLLGISSSMAHSRNGVNNNNSKAKEAETDVAFAPKLKIREIANKRKIPEAQPCRFQETLELPEIVNENPDPKKRRTTNSMKKLESGEYEARFADLFSEDDEKGVPTASLRSKFVDDEYKQRFGNAATSSDGIGIEL